MVSRACESSSRHATRGFTLIELVSVMVVLGILAALAVPKFLDLQSSAYRATVAGTAGAFSSAVRTANMICVMRDWAGKVDLPGYGAGNVDFNSDCYPSDTNGSNSIGNNNNRCVRVWNAILAAAPTVAVSPSSDYRASASSDVCTYTLQLDPNATREFTYNSLTGEVTVTSNP